jgi:ATP synthase protein I
MDGSAALPPNDRDHPASPSPVTDFDARLAKARGDQRDWAGKKKADGPGLPSSAFGMAMRIGIELVAGVAVGALIGYALDQWLGTTPWLLILMFFLGSGAGVMNVYRAATGKGLSMGYRRPDDGEGSG